MSEPGWLRICLVMSGILVAGATLADDREPADMLRSLLEQGHYAQAEIEARALLADTRVRSGPDSLETAEVLDLLVRALRRGGKAGHPETREFAERALAIKEARLGTSSVGFATSLRNLANLLRSLGQYDEARPLYDRALAVVEQAVPRDEMELGSALNDLGALCWYVAEYEGAREYYERALAVFERIHGPEHPRVAAVVGNLAMTRRKIGDFDEARRLHERALAIYEAKLGPEHPKLANALNSLGGVLYKQGDYARAREMLERALAMREKLLGPEHPRVASTLYNLSILLEETGNDDRALEFAERALAIRESAHGPDHPKVGYCLHTLANLARRRGDHAEARRFYERAIAIWERALGPDHPEVAMALHNTAELLVEIGHFAEALQHQERALAIHRTHQGPDGPDVGGTLVAMAVARARLGDRERARSLFEQGLQVLERSVGREHPTFAGSLSRFAEFMIRSGEPDLALQASLRAEAIRRRQLRLTSRTLAERQALRYALWSRRGLDVALTLASGGLEEELSRKEVLDAVIRSRAVVLDEMAARNRRLSEAADPRVTRLAASLDEARQALARLLVHGPAARDGEGYIEAVHTARLRTERAERALALASQEFEREMARRQVGIEEVAAAMPAGSALVSYVRHDRLVPGVEAGASRTVDSYVALVLAPGADTTTVIPLGAAEDIDARVGAWRERAAAKPPALKSARRLAERRYFEAGQAARRAIWDPLERHLESARHVFVVPDGALNLVSFGALPVGPDRYLVESERLIHYLSAERDLARRRADSPGSGLLVIGAPDFETRPDLAPGDEPSAAVWASATEEAGGPYRGSRASCADFASLRFSPLPATDEEASEISALWTREATRKRTGEPAVRLGGASALEAVIKRRASAFRVLHLATHGFFVDGGCDSAPARRRDRVSTAAPGDNPLLLSGLALAGANRRKLAVEGGDDGILTAEEVASLDLRSVEWVVLSACETGLGAVLGGEGVLGMRRAFQIAGAGTLVMSLWSVQDKATRAWMRELYEARLAGMSTASAVRQASVEVLEARRRAGFSTHPFFWGAFVAAGDWR